jgi:hypothetical protein
MHGRFQLAGRASTLVPGQAMVKAMATSLSIILALTGMKAGGN